MPRLIIFLLAVGMLAGIMALLWYWPDRRPGSRLLRYAKAYRRAASTDQADVFTPLARQCEALGQRLQKRSDLSKRLDKAELKALLGALEKLAAETDDLQNSPRLRASAEQAARALLPRVQRALAMLDQRRAEALEATVAEVLERVTVFDTSKAPGRVRTLAQRIDQQQTNMPTLLRDPLLQLVEELRNLADRIEQRPHPGLSQRFRGTVLTLGEMLVERLPDREFRSKEVTTRTAGAIEALVQATRDERYGLEGRRAAGLEDTLAVLDRALEKDTPSKEGVPRS